MPVNDSNQDQWAQQIKTALGAAQANSDVRSQLAARRHAALSAAKPQSREYAPVIAWLGAHRWGAIISTCALVLGVVAVWPKPEVRLEQYAANDVTAQVVDEVLYDSLDE
ncbi:hypothetical protein NT239_06655 [Chitinibacter sp. SCUT-21]|uniref:hypothetical protein n=1 Tax=Chitinibacter sp. SCUT-21 TaxID=2970891 RepID=UPI0035A62ED1